jgi:hypothetical protein
MVACCNNPPSVRLCRKTCSANYTSFETCMAAGMLHRLRPQNLNLHTGRCHIITVLVLLCEGRQQLLQAGRCCSWASRLCALARQHNSTHIIVRLRLTTSTVSSSLCFTAQLLKPHTALWTATVVQTVVHVVQASAAKDLCPSCAAACCCSKM